MSKGISTIWSGSKDDLGTMRFNYRKTDDNSR